jgi:hypothetical protein
MDTQDFEFLTTLSLRHNGDCSLLGVTPTLTIFVEEVYGEDGWLAQHAITLDGTFIASVDESFGTATELAPLSLPGNLVEPKRGWHTMALNFTGPRHRGLRGPERLDDLVRPFSIQEKIALVKQLELDVLPPLLLGLAESYVLAEAPIRTPNLFVVCRRLRLVYVLSEVKEDSAGERYDYDTTVLYVAHLFDRAAEQEPPLSDVGTGLTGIALYRPMDCLICKEHLFIADGGGNNRDSAVHVWRIQGVEPELSGEENLQRKLYG